jgi:acyl dehydratase
MTMGVKVGDTFTWERTFEKEDIVKFAEMSGDKGIHHVKPDADGRLMVHGLLTATIPTKLGGDLHYIARVMNMEFVRPVFAGDTIHCEMTITKVEPRDEYDKVTAKAVCRNQQDKEVLRSHYDGIIRKRK